MGRRRELRARAVSGSCAGGRHQGAAHAEPHTPSHHAARTAKGREEPVQIFCGILRHFNAFDLTTMGLEDLQND